MNWLRRLFAAPGPMVRLAGDRTIHLPGGRRLVPVGSDPVVIDLATSQVSGLIIHEPEDNVRSVFGRPDVDAVSDETLLYGPQGLGVVLIQARVHAFHFWVSAEAADHVLLSEGDPGRLLARFAQTFTPCSARVVGRGREPLRLGPGLSRADIESALGEPDKVAAWPDGGNTLTYFGRVPSGDYDRLHLDLKLSSDRFRGAYLTH